LGFVARFLTSSTEHYEVVLMMNLLELDTDMPTEDIKTFVKIYVDGSEMLIPVYNVRTEPVYRPEPTIADLDEVE
jgi:hypothetical protein